MKIKKEKINNPKRLLKIVSAVTVAVIIIGSVSALSSYAIAEKNSIGKDAAVNSAYAAAGIPEEKIDAVKTKFKFDKGRFVYDVEFYSEGKEYEYKIHSKDGSVVEFEHPDIKPLPKNAISVEKAKKIAVEHSGLTPEEVTFTKAKLEKKKGAYEYKIEFKTADMKYEYSIIAGDGTIRKSQNTPISEENSEIFPEDLITIKEAKEKALSHAAVAIPENAYFTKTKLEKEKGTFYFEIEFVYENVEYEYEINALTGEVSESSAEEKDFDDEYDKGKEIITDKNVISIEEAKAVALAHSKLSAENVTFKKAELDEENGKYVYEIEFSANEKNYEYEISAIDGSVIEGSWEAFFENKKNDENNETNEAKNIAFKDAGIEAPEIPHKVENNFGEKGHKIEIEFSTEKGHFKYEINAETDEIIEKDFKPFKENEKTGKEIGLDVAKKKALEHISASDDEVIFTKAKLDKDDSPSEYDIEFIHKGKKHEFSIHATTGEILEIDD